MIDSRAGHSRRKSFAYPISYRQLQEMIEKRGAAPAHPGLNRWVIKCS